MEFDKGLVGGSTIMLVLSLLNEKDMYGYEIIRELGFRSNHAFQFKEGTLYPVLHRCENQGYVKSYRKEAENGKVRKYYAITREGARQLDRERGQWRAFAVSVERIIGGNAYVGCEA